MLSTGIATMAGQWTLRSFDTLLADNAVCYTVPNALKDEACLLYTSKGCDREADKQDSVLVLLPFGEHSVQHPAVHASFENRLQVPRHG